MIWWLRLIRWPNLVLIILIQVLIYFRFYNNATLDLTHQGIPNGWDVMLLILSLVLVTAGGFIINDITDQASDAINKLPVKRILPNYISESNAYRTYILIFITGLIISLYESWHLGFYFSFLIFPLSYYLFYAYAKYLKCTVLFGNLFVSLMITSMILLLPYAYWNVYGSFMNEESFSSLQRTLTTLCLFSFTGTLYREIIKDIEDYEGDAKCKCRTTSVFFGIKRSEYIAISLLILMAIIVSISSFGISSMYNRILHFIVNLTPLIFLLYIHFNNNELQQKFRRLSFYFKLYMLIGMIYFCLFY